MPKYARYVVMFWRGNPTLYRQLPAMHGNPPAHDLRELGSVAEGTLEIWEQKPAKSRKRPKPASNRRNGHRKL